MDREIDRWIDGQKYRIMASWDVWLILTTPIKIGTIQINKQIDIQIDGWIDRWIDRYIE